MFGLIRRISNSVLHARPDRPWDDDATSNAPKTGRKRRLSSTERDSDEDAETQSRVKKSRGDTLDSSPVPDSEGVKEVTKGVKEVELEQNEQGSYNEAEVASTDDRVEEEAVVAPETIPLPEAVSGELDETSSIASTPPAATEDENEESSESGENPTFPSEPAVKAEAETESIKDEPQDSGKETPAISVGESLLAVEAAKKDEA